MFLLTQITSLVRDEKLIIKLLQLDSEDLYKEIKWRAACFFIAIRDTQTALYRVRT